MAISGGTIVSYLELDMGQYSSALQMARKQASVLGDSSAGAKQKVQGVGQALQTVGGVLTRNVTVPVIGLGIAATKSSIEQETAFAGVRKTVDATETQYKRLDSALHTMSSGQRSSSYKELAAIMEISGQLGVPLENLEKFTGVIADLEKSTDLTGEAAATMLAQYANVTGMRLDDIDRMGATIVDLGNSTATTESKIVGFMQGLSGMGKTIGIADTDIAGLAATLASIGLDEAAGSSSVNRVMQNIKQSVIGGTESLDLFAETAGMTAEQFSQQFGQSPLMALDAFTRGLKRISDSGGDVYEVLDSLKLNDIRVTDTLLRLAGAEGQLAANTQRAAAAWAMNTALTEEAGKRYATTESRLQMAKNALANAGDRIGDALTPMLAKGAQAVANFAEGFAQMSEGAQQTTVGLLGTAAAAGPVLKLGGKLLPVLAKLGPAGWAVAGVGAIALITKAISDADRAATKARLDERFGDIALSAEEMDAVIEQNYARNPWTEQLQSSISDIEASLQNVSDIQQKMDKIKYLAKVGVDTEQLQALPALVEQQIATVQTLISQENSTCVVAVKAVFGEDSEEGDDLSDDFNAYFGGLEAQAAAAGAKVKEAYISAIADGEISDAEERAIAALQDELNNILQKAQLTDTGAKRALLNYQASNMQLTPESIQGLAKRANDLMQSELSNEEMTCDITMEAVAGLRMQEGATQEAINRELKRIEEQSNRNRQQITLSNVELNWQLYGQQVTDSFSGEMEAMQNSIDDVWQRTVDQTQAYMQQTLPQLEQGTTQYASAYRSKFNEILQYEWLQQDGNGLFPTSDVRKEAAEMWKALEPSHEVLRSLIDAGVDVGDELTQAFQLGEAMKQLATSPNDIISQLTQTVEQSSPEMLQAGASAATSAVEGISSGDYAGAGAQAGESAAEGMGSADYAGAGSNAGGSFADALGATAGKAAAAGSKVAAAAVGAMRAALQIASPSKVTRGLGQFVGQGLALGITDMAKTSFDAGAAVSREALRGIEQAAQIASPSKAAIADGKFIGLGLATGIIATTLVQNGAIIAAQKKAAQDRARAAAAAAKAAAEAQAEREKAQKLQALKDEGAALIAQDAANHQRRMDALNGQWSAMMGMAGAYSVFYQDSPLEKQELEVKQRYKLLLEQLEEQHEARMADIKKNGTDEQKKAAEDAYKDRVAALKEQQREETDLLKKQYDAQKDIARRFVDAQKSALQNQLDKLTEQDAQRDVQEQLARLQKQQRQSKSARERRELQEEMDELIHQEALRQARQQTDALTAAWDKVSEAISAGVIGLGDLTGDRSLPTLAFGQGLSAIPNMTQHEREQIMEALSANVQPTMGSAAGNTYQIDLRGAVVRDEDDVRLIVDQIEARLRAAAR